MLKFVSTGPGHNKLICTFDFSFFERGGALYYGVNAGIFTNSVSELNKIWCEFLMEESTGYASDLTSASRDIKRISLTSK